MDSLSAQSKSKKPKPIKINNKKNCDLIFHICVIKEG